MFVDAELRAEFAEKLLELCHCRLCGEKKELGATLSGTRELSGADVHLKLASHNAEKLVEKATAAVERELAAMQQARAA